MKGNNLLLIGLRGAGKSTVARHLAGTLGFTLVDTDEEIERLAGKSIPEIFATEGEAHFRLLEAVTLLRFGHACGCVIAVGSGALTIPENVPTIEALGFVVWLEVDPKTALSRIRGSDRPRLTSRPLAEEIEALAREREPSYEEAADAIVVTSHASPEKIATKIVQAYRQQYARM